MKKFSGRQKFLKEQTSKDYQVYHEAIEIIKYYLQIKGYSTQTHVAVENEQRAPRLIGRYLIRTNRNIELQSNHPNVCVRPVRVNRCRLQRLDRV